MAIVKSQPWGSNSDTPPWETKTATPPQSKANPEANPKHDESNQTKFISDLDGVLCKVRDTLITKNKAYGDSALSPIRVFSKASPQEQLLVRIDDKLSRLSHGNVNLIKEDVILDLIGYLVILEIAETRASKGNSTIKGNSL